MKFNPFYDSDKLGWKSVCLEENDLCYEFNTLAFWSTGDGEIYTASDSGCSCPTPFEDYEGEGAEAIKQGLERVGDIEQARRIIESWVSAISDKEHRPSASEREHVLGFVVDNLKTDKEQ